MSRNVHSPLRVVHLLSAALLQINIKPSILLLITTPSNVRKSRKKLQFSAPNVHLCCTPKLHCQSSCGRQHAHCP